MGTPGDVNSEQVKAAARDIVRRTDQEAILGVYVDDPAWSGAWASRGFRFQCVSFDGRMLLDAASAVISQARGSAR